MTKLTKSQRKQVRELVSLVYTRELTAALEQIENDFQRWRAGDIDAIDLDERIHGYHRDISRKIWDRWSPASDWELALPAALHHGLLGVRDFPDDLWDALGSRIEEIKNGLFENA